MNLLLIASSNGLGHARRLVNLLVGFRNFPQLNISLGLTERQMSLLGREISFVAQTIPFKLLVLQNFGIDGDNYLSQIKVKTIPLEIIKAIQAADAVIADNSLWPAEFSREFFLLGHFDWLSNYQDEYNENPQTEFGKRWEFERQLSESVKIWFKLKHFGVPSVIKSEILTIPLPQYEGDLKKKIERENKIWAAYGTTLRNIEKVSGNFFSEEQVIERETWHLFEDYFLPRLVVGRPGLGTIRDCLASGTIFYPLFHGQDLELQHNCEVLKHLGLVSLDNLEETWESILVRDEFSNRIQEFWLQASRPMEIIAASILEELK